MLHQKYKRRTDYCCCTGTVHCRYCVGQGKPPHLTVDKDYNTVSIESKAYMDEQEKYLKEYCLLRVAELRNKEPINELIPIMNDTLKTQNQFVLSVKRNNFIVGSVTAEGTLSFSSNPTVHASASLVRAECVRLARLNPGKLYIFVQLAGGELTPAMTNLSI